MTKKIFIFFSMLALLLVFASTAMAADTTEEFSILSSEIISQSELQYYMNYDPNIDNSNEIKEYLKKIDRENKAENLTHEKDSTQSKVDIKAASSNYGAAWAYTKDNRTSNNCYGYAGNYGYRLNPGDIAYTSGASYTINTTVNQVAQNALADFSRAYRQSRKISSATTSVNSGEYRVAVRVGYKKINNQDVWDYHWMLQCSDGGWCEKHGQQPSQYVGKINPSNYSWDLGPYKGFYNSSTVYLAVKK